MRCLARRPEALRAKTLPGIEVVEGDVLNAPSVRAAMTGVGTAYYLVHSMGSTQSFEEQDRIGAQNFANAAREAGVGASSISAGSVAVPTNSPPICAAARR